MTPGTVSERTILQRVDLIEQLVGEIEILPLDDTGLFFTDNRNIWTVESCLRRSLEALLDIGRHILAKGYGRGVTEYREIAVHLEQVGILTDEQALLFGRMAGYRNRMVHLYHEVTHEELLRISIDNLDDILIFADVFRRWVLANPDRTKRDL